MNSAQKLQMKTWLDTNIKNDGLLRLFEWNNDGMLFYTNDIATRPYLEISACPENLAI